MLHHVLGKDLTLGSFGHSSKQSKTYHARQRAKLKQSETYLARQRAKLLDTAVSARRLVHCKSKHPYISIACILVTHPNNRKHTTRTREQNCWGCFHFNPSLLPRAIPSLQGSLVTQVVKQLDFALNQGQGISLQNGEIGHQT